MSTRLRQLLAGTATGAVLLAVGCVGAPAAEAGPGIPPNCELVAGTLFCDGPIGANQGWERCEMKEGRVMVLFPGAYLPGIDKCGHVTQDTLPPGSPPHHIG